MKKLLGITGIRSDYDLMSLLYRRLAADDSVDFKLLVGGAHLSKTYGYSLDLIRADGIEVLATIESLLDADSRSARLKSAAIMLQSAVDVVSGWQPDLILYAGDREEVLLGAALGAYLEIPTVHFYGGDHLSTGHVDNSVRHAASKLSTYHVVSIEQHRQRLLAIGEARSRISVIGSMALDNFVSQVPLDLGALRERLGFPLLAEQYALVLFHPEPTERAQAAEVCRNILLELRAAGLPACIGYPNTDPSNREIIAVLDEFRDERGFWSYKNLPRHEFVSLYKHAALIIGNSSSGILEAASIPIAAISVGVRQRGRYAAGNVIFADTDRAAIGRALARARSDAFRESIEGMENPYGDGASTGRALELLRTVDFDALRLKTEDPTASGDET